MNNLFSFWLAPVMAFFDPRVYRHAAMRSGKRGILYNLYCAGLVTLLVMIILTAKVAPSIDKIFVWLQKDMPVLVWTPEGLSMESNVPQPYTLTHPMFGPVAIFDMNKTTVTEAEMRSVPVLVTAKKIFLRRGPEQIEERDITQTGLQPQPNQQKLPNRVRITGELMGQFYNNFKRVLFAVIPFVFFIVFFLLFLFSALFYSLVGLLFNRMRKAKLGYGRIFNLTCFALMPAFVLGWILKGVPASWFLSVLINLGYLFFAFKISDEEAAKG